jgi:hypothetical protein
MVDYRSSGPALLQGAGSGVPEAEYARLIGFSLSSRRS